MRASPRERLRLGRARRLRSGRDFARMRTEGERTVAGCLIANWRRLPPDGTPRLAVVTGRKLGGAVVRNRARRLMREAFRLHQHDLATPAELVLVARPSIVGKNCADVERDLLMALRRAKLLKPAANAAAPPGGPRRQPPPAG